VTALSFDTEDALIYGELPPDIVLGVWRGDFSADLGRFRTGPVRDPGRRWGSCWWCRCAGAGDRTDGAEAEVGALSVSPCNGWVAGLATC